jgi:hypothetical protein
LADADTRTALGLTEAVADDRGIYRLYGMIPGRYLLVVTGSRGNANVTLPVYFPGVTEPDRAELIRLQAGETRSSVDFVLSRALGYAVTGRVTGLPPNSTSQNIAVSLFPGGGQKRPIATTQTGGDGRFHFEGAPAGSYEIVAAGPVLGITGFGALLGENSFYGRKRFESADPQINDLEIPLQASQSLEGQFTFDREPGGACLSDARVSLDPIDPTTSSMPLTIAIDSRGIFRFHGIAPVRYRISVLDLKKPCFLKEVRVGDRTLPDRIVMADEKNRLNMALTTQHGEIGGTAVAERTPYAGATIVLAPVGNGGAVRPQDAAFAISASDGGYRVDGLAPGPYRMLALAQVSSNDYLSPSFWAAHKDQTVLVSVDPAAAVRLNIEVLPRRSKDDEKF